MKQETSTRKIKSQQQNYKVFVRDMQVRKDLKSSPRIQRKSSEDKIDKGKT
jgi:hypothetical protein